MKEKLISFFKQLDFSWRSIEDYLLILLGAFLQALSMRLFLVPASLVSGGISGIAQILHYTVGWPIGLVVLLGNIPLFIVGWRYLGGPRFALRTMLSIAAFSIFTDLLISLTGSSPITSDILLNTLYGGMLLGVGLGIVYLGRGTSGGTDILGRVLNRRLGISISMAYLLTDSFAVLLAGFFFGWEKALYGLFMIYLSGVAADTTSQGSSVIRSAFIITDETEKVILAIQDQLDRGATIISAKGGYTGKDRPIVYCVVTAAEVVRLKAIVHECDPDAFMVVGQANEALGEGFKPLHEG
ncbi:MAG TPA: YitT family protein [Anaerolineaceae bacterium]|nr:YitT family protein [Anaerolineaceae bacterium]HPT23449.1 YitT family protein [Anaerolineaceae bacterium]